MDFDKIRRQAGKNFSPKKFFCSSRVVKYIATRLHRISEQFGVPRSGLSVMYDEESSITARTDNRTTQINAGHMLFNGDEGTRLSLLLGAALHEQGHRLFTNFTLSKQLIFALSEGKGIGEEPAGAKKKDKQKYKKLQALLEDKAKAAVFIPVFKDYLNCLEDGRIERMLMMFVKGMESCKTGLMLLRERMADETLPIAEADEMVASGAPKLYALAAPLLYAARFAAVKGYDPASPTPLGKRMQDLLPFVEAYTAADNTMAAHRAFLAMMVELEPEIEEFLEFAESNPESGSGSGEGDPEDTGEGAGDGEGSESESETKPGKGSKPLSSMSEEELDALVKAIEKAIAEATSNALGEEDLDAMEGQGSERSSVKEAMADAVPDLANKEKTDPHKHAEAECPEIFSLPTTEIFSSGNGEVTKGYIEADPIELDLDKLKNAFLGDESEAAANDALVGEYDNIVNTTDFGAAHRNADLVVERINGDLDDLSHVLKELERETLSISKKMARKSDFFEKDRESISVKGLYSGTKFEASRVARPDYKYFSKKKVYDEPTSLAVSLVVDESGSMYGLKEQVARSFALIMYDYITFLKERSGIEIPLNIIGHTETGGTTNVFVYTDSEMPDKKDRLRLMDIKARSNNRDGHAIRLALKRLEEVESNQKLLVVVTDGQPAAFGYGGAAAEADLKDVAKYCEKEGIALLVAAIDKDKDKIKRIYGERHFIDIQNLDTLASRIIKVIQNELATA